jgi:hypothetical protein
MERFKLQWLNKKPNIIERKPNLFYYDIRNSEIDNGYQIEQEVFINNIGSLVTDKDILKDKDFLTDEELQELEYDEVNNLY